MQERGEPVTSEERSLAADTVRRERVLQMYRTFDPIETDTSYLTPEAVLETVLAILHRYGLC
ncbi:hypothetical protein F4Y93_00145 [Candidatus Poribacteria bacterium]|nr:hypothetical protein [Candidatus Poribacteria bacterium]